MISNCLRRCCYSDRCFPQGHPTPGHVFYRNPRRKFSRAPRSARKSLVIHDLTTQGCDSSAKDLVNDLIRDNCAIYEPFFINNRLDQARCLWFVRRPLPRARKKKKLHPTATATTVTDSFVLLSLPQLQQCADNRSRRLYQPTSHGCEPLRMPNLSLRVGARKEMV